MNETLLIFQLQDNIKIICLTFTATCYLPPYMLCLFTGYTGPLDLQQNLTTQKVRVACKNHEKSNIVISWFITICNEREMVCWGMERGFIIQMTIIKQSEGSQWTQEKLRWEILFISIVLRLNFIHWDLIQNILNALGTKLDREIYLGHFQNLLTSYFIFTSTFSVASNSAPYASQNGMLLNLVMKSSWICQ